MVTQAQSNLTAIKTKVRRLTASPDPSQLSESDLEDYINTFYSQDFISSVKTDQLKSVLEVFTQPNIDTYTVDVNNYQSFRGPVYFQGRQGQLFKDRNEFYGWWPRNPTLVNPTSGDGTVGPYTFTLSPVPFLRNDVTLGVVDSTGSSVQVQDDGNGNLVLANTSTVLGTINYTTGAVSITFTNIIPSGNEFTVYVSQYNTGFPINILFWNNKFTVRPVPDGVYKITIETYKTPTQFLNNTDSPTLNQWHQYISFGAAIEILQDRGDWEGVANLEPEFKNQEALCLERQANEEIGTRNGTIFTNNASPYGANGMGWY